MKHTNDELIKDNLLSLIGDTPCVRYNENFFIKYEGFNPSGAITDRLLLHSLFRGSKIMYKGSSQTCASISMLGAIMQIPVVINPTNQSGFTKISKAFGAEINTIIKSNIELNYEEALLTLIQEIKNDVPEVGDIYFSDDSSLIDNVSLKEYKDIKIHYVDFKQKKKIRKIQHGAIIDQRTKELLGIINNPDRVSVIVSNYDGAMDFV